MYIPPDLQVGPSKAKRDLNWTLAKQCNCWPILGAIVQYLGRDTVA
jgi:hypothetical protein